MNLKSSYRGGSSWSFGRSSYRYSSYYRSYGYYGGGSSVIIIGGYYNSYYGYRNEKDEVCKNMTCTHCCVEGQCRDDEYCKAIAPSSFGVGAAIFLIFVLVFCCACIYAIIKNAHNRAKHGYLEPLNHSFHSHSSHHSHHHVHVTDVYVAGQTTGQAYP